MIWEEREAARAERETAAAEARVEREREAVEQRRLMADVFKLKLQLVEERDVARGGPSTVGSRGELRGPIEVAVQSGAAAVGDRITNPGGTAVGLDGIMHAEPMRWMGSKSASSPERSRTIPSSRNGDSGAVPVWNIVRTKSNRSKMSPCLMVGRPSFQLESRISSDWPSFTACLGFL